MSEARSGVSIFPERDRAIFNRIRKHMAKQNYKGVIQPATMRTEVYTANGQNEYVLSLKDTAPKLSSGASREIRLKDQDAFVITRLRLGLLLETIAGPVGNERIHLFNSLLPFVDEVGGFQNAHLSAVYNGNLNLKVGDTTYLDEYSLEDCYVPATQQETASLKSERGYRAGYIDVTPQIGLRGFDSNDLRFKCPNVNANHKIQYTATSKVVLVFQFGGFKITGAGTGNYNLNFAND